MTSSASSSPESRRAPAQTAPTPLTVACAVAGLEGLAYGVVGVVSLASVDSDRLAFSVSIGVFFLLVAGFLGFCAWRLRQLHVWARSPLVMVQLLQIPVAISTWGDGVWAKLAPVLMLACSAVALVGIFHPQSIAAVENADD